MEEAFHPRRTLKVRARRPRRLKQEDSSKPGPPPLPEDRVKLTVTVLGVAGRGDKTSNLFSVQIAAEKPSDQGTLVVVLFLFLLLKLMPVFLPPK